MRRRSTSGFSLVELMVVTAIFVVVILGLIQVLISGSVIVAMTTNITRAIAEAQNKIEAIRDHTFSSITTDFGSGGTPGNTFNLSSLNGKGVIYIDATNPALLKVDVVICWRDRMGRVVGEDKNLNGTLDFGEDLNGNGKLDSPVTISMQISEHY